MIVSSAKLKEVRIVLETICDGGEIILRGPCGSGKTTALQEACRDLGYRLMTYTGVNGDISDFMSSCSRLTARGTQKIIVYCPGADSLEYYCQNSDKLSLLPFVKVFTVQEGSMACYRATQRLPRATFVSFNSFSETALSKALLGSIDPSRVETARDILRSCGGDLRQAINQLHAAGIETDNKENTLSNVRKRKGPDANPKPSSDTKDSMYSLYHILGKILYNKEGTIATVEKLVEDPIIVTAGFSPIDWIQENTVDFVSDMTSLKPIFETISTVDCWRYRTDELANIAVGVVFKTTCMRPSETGITGKRGFKPFRKPSGRSYVNRALETKAMIEKLEDEQLSGRISPRLLHLLLKVYDTTRKRKEVIFQSHLESDPIEDC